MIYWLYNMEVQYVWESLYNRWNKNNIRKNSKKFRSKKSYIIGSYAKNIATSSSDIDLVIDSEGKLLNIYFYGLLEELVQNLKKNIDLFEILKIQTNSRIYNDITKEGVIVYEK